jgi:RNA polymerase sigma factor (sigma-70 family)
MTKESAQTRLLKAFREHESQLRGYLHRFTDSDQDIDDICQEAMARYLEAAKDRGIQHPGAFLFGIARNLVRKRFERKSRSLIDFIADFSPDDYVADVRPLDDIMDEQERLTRYDQAIARLPPQCQRVFVMRKVYGYSHREIAGMLSISIKTVENHISTGLKRCSDDIAGIEGVTQQHKAVINFPKRR